MCCPYDLLNRKNHEINGTHLSRRATHSNTQCCIKAGIEEYAFHSTFSIITFEMYQLFLQTNKVEKAKLASGCQLLKKEEF